MRGAPVPFLAVLLALASASCSRPKEEGGPRTLRVGHFPNLTHAQALVAHRLSRAGEGWFEARLGGEARIEWYVYPAGPSAMEAILNGSIDLAYVGPNPAVNAHLRSGGAEVRAVAGAAEGGSALVVQGDGRIKTAADLRGRRVATPQFGNTQDVACRAWLVDRGFRVTATGGDVLVVPTENPDQLGLFRRGEIDAAWTVEPWVSRLELEANGRIFLEDRDAVTTLLVASARFLEREPRLAQAFVRAHAELTAWMSDDPEEARRLVREELAAETTREVPAALVERSWDRLRFTCRLPGPAIERFVRTAESIGFLKGPVDLSRFVSSPWPETRAD
ncbi:MAG: ABC transporter substrate-binding protein [Planctomycetes bacterium]|nr:ABC transporter substrate-binding protein [Planctomycetota bacterium]